jgi:hypothetical protein
VLLEVVRESRGKHAIGSANVPILPIVAHWEIAPRAFKMRIRFADVRSRLDNLDAQRQDGSCFRRA